MGNVCASNVRIIRRALTSLAVVGSLGACATHHPATPIEHQAAQSCQSQVLSRFPSVVTEQGQDVFETARERHRDHLGHDYSFQVVEDPGQPELEMMGVCPGGWVFATPALLENRTEAEKDWLFAHEFGHEELGHFESHLGATLDGRRVQEGQADCFAQLLTGASEGLASTVITVLDPNPTYRLANLASCPSR